MSYCSKTNVQSRLSVAGLSLRIDGNPAAFTEAQEEADGTIDYHLSQRYDPNQLLTSSWVTTQAANLTAYFFCEYKGDPVPVGIAQKYERTMALLVQIMSGEGKVPGIGMKKSSAPVMSNVRSTLRPHPRGVTEKARSTGEPAGYDQNTDPYDAAGLNSTAITGGIG